MREWKRNKGIIINERMEVSDVIVRSSSLPASPWRNGEGSHLPTSTNSGHARQLGLPRYLTGKGGQRLEML